MLTICPAALGFFSFGVFLGLSFCGTAGSWSSQPILEERTGRGGIVWGVSVVWGWYEGVAARAPAQQLQEDLLPLGKDRLGAFVSFPSGG